MEDARQANRRDLRETVHLAVPLAVAQMATLTMGLVDTACVGHYSALELAATATGNALALLPMALGMGFGLALEPLISQALGAGEDAAARAWWRAGLRLAIQAGVPLGLLTLAMAQAMPALGIEALLSQRATAYLVARLPSMALLFHYYATRSYLQAHGRTRPLLVAALVANVFNLAANLLLVYGDGGLVQVGLPAIGLPPLGAVGAGVATSLASGVMAAVAWRAGLALEDGDAAQLPPDARRTMLRLALPLGLTLLAEMGVFGATGLLAATLGERVAGAHQIALHLSSISFMGAVGVAGATGTRVGRAIGAGASTAARRAGASGAIVALGFMGTAMLLFLLFPTQLASFFSADPPVIALAARLITIAGLFQLFDGLQAVMAGALRGAGDVHAPLVANVLAHWCFGFPMAAVLAVPLGVGAEGLWYGLTLGLAVAAGGLSLRFVRLTRAPVLRVAPPAAGPGAPRPG
ncbi:MAG: MATE family efflux transporter [Deltaproteobacteria bacterium]|nr:MATE family efflux transporter [Deltaproteobacteria bacterium]MCB9789250.1 MATE family efflux transporter [Deltaproteobacteria bacterium]